MARTPRKSRRSGARRQVSGTKQGLIILRKKGLVGKTEYQQAKPTKAARNLVRKYRDVIEGRATIVTPRTRLIPTREKKALKMRRGKAVVPKVPGTVATSIKRVKTGKRQYRTEIQRTRRVGGKLQREYVPIPLLEVPKLPPGKYYRVTSVKTPRRRVGTRNFYDPKAEHFGSSRYFKSSKDLQDFLNFYGEKGQEYLDIAITDLQPLGIAA